MTKKVAIITRTRSRPRMLERAMKSVAAQTMKDFVWVIVNDGGAKVPVDHVVQRAREQGIEVVACHHESNVGMEAASNAGIRSSKSKYITIHDDDDTWEPHFLEETSSFLDGRPEYIGVVAQAMRILERMGENRIVEVKRIPHAPVLQAVHLADMARSNLFPPISFLYRRSLLKKLRGYDESLAVLGDWEFNLRALLVGDIGVIPKPLANYHVRKAQQGLDQAYENSIAPHLVANFAADAAIRNKWLRNDIRKGEAGLGFLLAMGRFQVKRSLTRTIGSRLQNFLGTRSLASNKRASRNNGA